MPLGIDLLTVQQDKVYKPPELSNVFVMNAPIRIEAYMYTFALEISTEWDQLLCLYGGFATTKGDTSSLTEEWLLIQCSTHDLGRLDEFAISTNRDGVGIGTVETSEVAALQEDDEPDTRPVERSQ